MLNRGPLCLIEDLLTRDLCVVRNEEQCQQQCRYGAYERRGPLWCAMRSNASSNASSNAVTVLMNPILLMQEQHT